MSTVTSSYLDSLKWKTETTPITTEKEAKSTSLTQEDFFSLLTQQLSYQDPFKPVENAEMVSQMTAFTTADGITQLNGQVESLSTKLSSSQALQASSLVGQKVLVEGSVGYSEGQGFTAVTSSDSATPSMTVRIEDAKGQVVRTYKLGAQEAGNVYVEWDGLDDAGQPVAAGAYKINAYAAVDGKNTQLPTAVYAQVNSVTLGSGGGSMALNLQGLGAVSLADVIEVSK